jgi:hypothetical protein
MAGIPLYTQRFIYWVVVVGNSNISEHSHLMQKSQISSRSLCRWLIQSFTLGKESACLE